MVRYPGEYPRGGLIFLKKPLRVLSKKGHEIPGYAPFDTTKFHSAQTPQVGLKNYNFKILINYTFFKLEV